MRLLYDLHIHSALSPCADNEMTPVNIVAAASCMGLDAIAVSDHNSIKNVEAAMEVGEAMDIIVVPAMEVQSSDDIHILALFRDYNALENFDNELEKRQIKNREDIFGEQLIINSDDEITGREENLLLVGVEQNIYDIFLLIKKNGGLAVPAHIDRDECGILAVLGEIPSDLGVEVIEFSANASEGMKEQYGRYRSINNSDSHRLECIGSAGGAIEAAERTAEALFEAITGGLYAKH